MDPRPPLLAVQDGLFWRGLRGVTAKDAAGTNWIEADENGKVVVGSGTTRLFSIDGSGNVPSNGIITASTTV